MNNKSLQTLEFYKIINQLKDLATSKSGKELCKNLIPSTDLEEIQHAQQETADALTRIFKKGSLSFSGTYDVRESLRHLELGGSIGIEELLHIAALLEAANRARSYSKKDREDIKDDSLDDMFRSLKPLTPISNEIRRCILSENEISDDASPGLKHIRRSMKLINDRIHTQLTSMVNQSTTRTYLQDAVVTMRNGRYCLPVKAEHRSKVPGMIHDQSSTGSTIFIEPMVIVKLNNEIKELTLKEQEEIEAVLKTLSSLVSEEIEAIEENFHILTSLDFIFARGQLAKLYNGSKPIFNQHGYIRIRQGRHPLLDKHTVVPIDIHLGDEFNLLIVTGPNTGGKTVSLKTVGLFTLMGQSGLHIPANDRSELSVFEEIYADIGDEQSIEQSLSTFSSHMTKIVTILKEANEKSLVLFDELGAGTDPVEGAALATAILSHLHNMGIRTMATTHYSELKVYALSTPGVENACCEFDVETLRPTYRLLIGIPGKSNAFAISSKLGLPDFIIESAKSKISEETENLEDLIADLETSRTAIENERLEIQKYKEEIETLKKKLEEKQEKFNSKKETILREANEKAYAILNEAKEYADNTIRNFNKMNQQSDASKNMENARNQLRGKLSDTEKKLAYKTKQTFKKNHKPSDFKLGDSVKVLSLNLKGTVSSLPDAKGQLFVQMGILRSCVHISDLVILDEPTITGPNIQKSSSGKIKMSKSASISTEINLIGKTTDEAIALLDKYLDDAYLAHVPSVRIVHGKGTGALRAAVHKHLKRLKYVKSFRLGAFGEGEAGVTIVEFT
ncbi:endonuclease MutS2 [Anaerosacchariphilus polymeriproducens]|uniref:Endonuclease MutS2 n=1 Tax=Anaerosacchariphilus polymeriproducens TaxID=1812858 RepID=A0A371AYE1_9FIRM|nr:endonuclease MutS2 [Anaerosacchariphilus polymeriproducens]RDU24581.1 endonuclease MutS2 [Anaerosacchariphilus polymeriproducens]